MLSFDGRLKWRPLRLKRQGKNVQHRISIKLVVYHELIALRRVYFARAAKPEPNKLVLALLIHDIPRRIHC